MYLAVAWLQHGQKAHPPGQARGCGVGFDLREVALLRLDPVNLIPDAQLVVQLVQRLASDPPFATRAVGYSRSISAIQQAMSSASMV
jgi:hypothetical protein